jgi:hypothetical protein
LSQVKFFIKHTKKVKEKLLETPFLSSRGVSNNKHTQNTLEGGKYLKQNPKHTKIYEDYFSQSFG